jgi:enoyl-CoA hydratase/carnithine racemase
LVGVTTALDLMITGRRLSPAEAYELGILDRLFPAEQLQEETLKYAQGLAAGAVGAIGSIKLAVHRGMDRPLREGLEVERGLVEPLFEGEESKEGLQAFMEKRKPEFSK